MSDGGPSCYTATTPRARKRHKCCECRGVIEAGEAYHKFSGIWDGEADTFKTCCDCEALRSKVIREYGIDLEFIPPFGQLGSELGGYDFNVEENQRAFVAIMQKRGATVHQSWNRFLTP